MYQTEKKAQGTHAILATLGAQEGFLKTPLLATLGVRVGLKTSPYGDGGAQRVKH